ncbi:unnamed protein product, partial [Adineta steineri]
MATTNNMCYEPKPTHNTPTTSGSVSVLACFKTTKKRNKERAIMPRPSTTDSNETSTDLQQRLNTPTNINNTSILNSDIPNISKLCSSSVVSILSRSILFSLL